MSSLRAMGTSGRNSVPNESVTSAYVNKSKASREGYGMKGGSDEKVKKPPRIGVERNKRGIADALLLSDVLLAVHIDVHVLVC